MSIDTDPDFESQALRKDNGLDRDDRKPSGDDPVSDWLLKTYYYLQKTNFQTAKIGIVAIPIISLVLFALFISNSTSNMIAFFALVVSLVFVAISMWLLCWILDKD